MTRPIFDFSTVIQSNLFLQSITQHPSTQISGSPVTYRSYMAVMVCLIGLGIFSAVQMPTSITAHPLLASTHVVSTDIQPMDSYSVFVPEDGLGLPSRREASGTR